jgi:hypothetical protein
VAANGVQRQVARYQELGLDQKAHPLLELVLVTGALELLDEILHGNEVN